MQEFLASKANMLLSFRHEDVNSKEPSVYSDWSYTSSDPSIQRDTTVTSAMIDSHYKPIMGILVFQNV